MSLVLAVDDDASVLAALQRLLAQNAHEVLAAESGEQALELARARPPDVVLADLHLGGIDGFETLRRLRTFLPGVPVVLLTGQGSTDTAIEAMKQGAFDYLLKPVRAAQLTGVLARALAANRVRLATLAVPALAPSLESPLIGTSPAMIELYKAIGQVAASSASVMILGESGSGKEEVARAIHRHGPRSGRPFAAVNCAALAETLLESELFGHERGAFTGADTRRVGLFEQAHGGTLLLDEVGDMSPSTQVKVLRVLQERSFERLGGNQTVTVDVRVLSATHQDLEQLLKRGRLRHDLYYRLRVVTLQVPPLRERPGDVERLVLHFLGRCAAQVPAGELRIAPEALRRLEAHAWPGNVRELGHCLQQAALMCRGGVIQERDLRLDGDPGGRDGRYAEGLQALARELLARADGEAHARLIERAEQVLIAEALRQSDGNLSATARRIGLSRPTLREKIQRAGLRAAETVGEHD